MNPSPYATPQERLEARRKSFRESKRRAAEKRAGRKAAIEEFLDKLINSGNGSPERRQMMLDILARRATT